MAAGLLGLASLGTGGVLLGAELTRKPTAREVKAAGEKEMALRTRFRTAGELFPARVRSVSESSVDAQEVKSTIRRVRIASEAKCADAVDEKAAVVLVKYGCRMVLRATYLDAGGGRLVTVGIAALRDKDSAVKADAALTDREGLRVAAFPETVSAEFDDARRQDLDTENHGPYILMHAAGFVDGRRKLNLSKSGELFDFVQVLLRNLGNALTKEMPPCKLKTVQC